MPLTLRQPVASDARTLRGFRDAQLTVLRQHSYTGARPTSTWEVEATSGRVNLLGEEMAFHIPAKTSLGLKGPAGHERESPVE